MSDMSDLRQQMDSLSSNLAASTVERHTMLAASKANTAALLKTFQRADAERIRAVATLRTGVLSMQHDFRTAAKVRQRRVHRMLADSTRAVSAQVVDLRATFADEQRARTSELREQAHDVKKLVTRFRHKRVSMTKELTTRLAAGVHALQAEMAGLQHSFMPAVHTHHAMHTHNAVHTPQTEMTASKHGFTPSVHAHPMKAKRRVK